MSLFDKFSLRKSFVYPSAQNTFDILPLVYGDLTQSIGSSGKWRCPLIDVWNNVYLIADHPILSVANGNSITVFRDGVALSSGFVVVTSGSDSIAGGEGRSISYIQFTTSQGDSEITVRAKGGRPGQGLTSTLEENPISILEDLLIYMGFSSNDFNKYHFERARRLANENGFVAAGVISEDKSPIEWISEILSSFLGDVWVDGSGLLSVSLDTLTSAKYELASILAERDLEDVEGVQLLENLCNRCLINYGYNYVLGTYEGKLMGGEYEDKRSQSIFGVMERSYDLKWVRRRSLALLIEKRIVEKFSYPSWVVSMVETATRSSHVERGDYVVYSWSTLRDENNLPLKNQIGRVLTIEPSLDDCTFKLTLEDTGKFLTKTPNAYDGTYTHQGTIIYGGVRNREDMV